MGHRGALNTEITAGLTAGDLVMIHPGASVRDGPDTPELASAVSEAGGLGSLGCGYLSGEQIDALVARTRSLTSKPFALNLFVRDDPHDDLAAPEPVMAILTAVRRELGLPPLGAAAKPPPRL